MASEFTDEDHDSRICSYTWDDAQFFYFTEDDGGKIDFSCTNWKRKQIASSVQKQNSLENVVFVYPNSKGIMHYNKGKRRM
jgi:hypothetical protein